MDIRQIKKLIDLINAETGVAEIEIKEGETSVRISRFSPATHAQPMAIPTVPSMPISAACQPLAMQADGTSAADPASTVNVRSINSPMVGTFYAASSPDVERFVKEGQRIKKGDTVCIIEAMKMFNQIEAECDGVIVKCLVDNGHPVEFGQPLFIIE